METHAELSNCRKYRYALWRTWDKSKDKVMFIGLNPSTASFAVQLLTRRSSRRQPTMRTIYSTNLTSQNRSSTYLGRVWLPVLAGTGRDRSTKSSWTTRAMRAMHFAASNFPANNPPFREPRQSDTSLSLLSVYV